MALGSKISMVLNASISSTAGTEAIPLGKSFNFAPALKAKTKPIAIKVTQRLFRKRKSKINWDNKQRSTHTVFLSLALEQTNVVGCSVQMLFKGGPGGNRTTTGIHKSAATPTAPRGRLMAAPTPRLGGAGKIVELLFCPSPLPVGGSTVLSLTRGPAGNRTTTSSLSATRECRDTNWATRRWDRRLHSRTKEEPPSKVWTGSRQWLH